MKTGTWWCNIISTGCILPAGNSSNLSRRLWLKANNRTNKKSLLTYILMWYIVTIACKLLVCCIIVKNSL